MTGELCDGFESKRQGVSAILDAVAAASPLPMHIWQTTGQFTDAAPARRDWQQTASANWLALATFAGRFARRGPALLIDVGSTTTDIVPLLDGLPTPQGRTDPERLSSGELVYRGVRRTPLCALLSEGAAELFATILDVFLVLEMLPEDPDDCGTADGRPATRRHAHARLARTLCADLETCSEQQRRSLALRVNLSLVTQLAFAVERVAKRMTQRPEFIVLSGSGEFLARLALENQTVIRPCGNVSLSNQLGPAVSTAACAYAAAILCQEREG
jgi:probable H4MPT-linked C1 transfer pathway protein